MTHFAIDSSRVEHPVATPPNLPWLASCSLSAWCYDLQEGQKKPVWAINSLKSSWKWSENSGFHLHGLRIQWFALRSLRIQFILSVHVTSLLRIPTCTDWIHDTLLVGLWHGPALTILRPNMWFPSLHFDDVTCGSLSITRTPMTGWREGSEACATRRGLAAFVVRLKGFSRLPWPAPHVEVSCTMSHIYEPQHFFCLVYWQTRSDLTAQGSHVLLRSAGDRGALSRAQQRVTTSQEDVWS